MSLQLPQTELPSFQDGTRLRGGADLWDDGLTGQIITAEFFEAPSGGILKAWVKVSGVWKDGIAWIKASSVWKEGTPYVRTGGLWK
jgi:hypothetical protein